MAKKINKPAVQEAITALASDRASEANWAALYRMLWPYVIGTVYRALGGTREGTEDIAQEVFLRLVKFCDFAAFPSADAFLGYVHAICQNTARDLMRKRPPDYGSEALENIASKASEDQRIDIGLALSKIFAELDPDELILAEYLLKGYTLKEISEMTEQSYGGLAVKIHRLRTRLRVFR